MLWQEAKRSLCKRHKETPLKTHVSVATTATWLIQSKKNQKDVSGYFSELNDPSETVAGIKVNLRN